MRPILLKLFTLALVLTMAVLPAVGCSGSSPSSTTTNASATVSVPSPTPVATASASETPTSVCTQLAAFLAVAENGEASGQRALDLHDGEWHNACVIVVSEALRRVGCNIHEAVDYTTELMQALNERGFVTGTDLANLQPGDICFTTDANGQHGDPTHTFVFLGWADQDLMNIYDNQTYDYGSQYHTRPSGRSFFNDQPEHVKEATAFYMRG